MQLTAASLQLLLQLLLVGETQVFKVLCHVSFSRHLLGFSQVI